MRVNLAALLLFFVLVMPIPLGQVSYTAPESSALSSVSFPAEDPIFIRGQPFTWLPTARH